MIFDGRALIESPSSTMTLRRLKCHVMDAEVSASATVLCVLLPVVQRESK